MRRRLTGTPREQHPGSTRHRAPQPIRTSRFRIHELGSDYLERRQPVAIVDRLVQRLRQLGVDVTVMAEGQSAPSPTQAMPAAVP